jgi:hypothetical protein
MARDQKKKEQCAKPELLIHNTVLVWRMGGKGREREGKGGRANRRTEGSGREAIDMDHILSRLALNCPPGTHGRNKFFGVEKF